MKHVEILLQLLFLLLLLRKREGNKKEGSVRREYIAFRERKIEGGERGKGGRVAGKANKK